MHMLMKEKPNAAEVEEMFAAAKPLFEAGQEKRSAGSKRCRRSDRVRGVARKFKKLSDLELRAIGAEAAASE